MSAVPGPTNPGVVAAAAVALAIALAVVANAGAADSPSSHGDAEAQAAQSDPDDDDGQDRPTPASPTATEDVFLVLTPDTVQAGQQVGLRGGCGGDPGPATVRSRAFDDELTLTPESGTGLFTGTATVPTDTRAADYLVRLRCDDGARARADLTVRDMARPTRGPDTGAGGARDNGPPGTVLLLVLGAGAALTAGAGLLVGYRRRSG